MSIDFQLPFSIVVCGKPHSGKSFFIKFLMQVYCDKFSYGIVFTKTKFNGGYDFIPQEFVHASFSEEILKNLMKIQASLREKGYALPNAFIIFDDCLGAHQFKSDIFVDLMTQYRHFNISLILSTQYIYKLSPTIRECCRFASIFRQTTGRSISAIYESFGMLFNNVREFTKYLQENTGDYNFILVDNESSSEFLHEIYRVLKCPAEFAVKKIEFTTKIKN